jgi:hypothetical protein
MSRDALADIQICPIQDEDTRCTQHIPCSNIMALLDKPNGAIQQ